MSAASPVARKEGTDPSAQVGCREQLVTEPLHRVREACDHSRSSRSRNPGSSSAGRGLPSSRRVRCGSAHTSPPVVGALDVCGTGEQAIAPDPRITATNPAVRSPSHAFPPHNAVKPPHAPRGRRGPRRRARPPCPRSLPPRSRSHDRSPQGHRTRSGTPRAARFHLNDLHEKSAGAWIHAGFAPAPTTPSRFRVRFAPPLVSLEGSSGSFIHAVFGPSGMSTAAVRRSGR